MLLIAWPPASAAFPTNEAACRTFLQTGRTVCGRFLHYWEQHGGLAQQGYPLSGELREVSQTDGNLYTVQYFERAIFEYHPEHAGTPYEVLLSLLGTQAYQQRYCCGARPRETPNSSNARFFPQTGKSLGGQFRAYWDRHGGLAQQGYPLTGEFQEKNLLKGQTYTVQYFERAVFEYHPENASPFDVLLSRLGTARYDRVRASRSPTPAPGARRSPTAALPPPFPTHGLPAPLPTRLAIAVPHP